jgi:hypothetical protein
LCERGYEQEDVSHFFGLVDQAEDIKNTLDFSSPVTSLFVLDQVWAGLSVTNNSSNNSVNFTEAVLENHLFLSGGPYSCERLVELEGTTITSMNGINWTISVGQNDGLPCFTSAGTLGGDRAACITECNILAKNGIAHTVDFVLVTPGTSISTLAPSASMASAAPSVSNPPSPSPTVAIDASIDLEGCMADLSAADADADGAVRRGEFYAFVVGYSKRKCIEVGDRLTAVQIAVFRELACICGNQQGVASKDCCKGTNAFLHISDSVLNQLEYKARVCEKVDRDLGQTECLNVPTTSPTSAGERNITSNNGGIDNGSNKSSAGASLASFQWVVASCTLHMLVIMQFVS